ncbi:MAG: type II CRISPR RNA-guided endonuclease Cas9, partial [Kiritimatiellales bacterium]
MGDVILGLDIGTASVGWAMLEKNERGNFHSIIASGVRIFEPGCEIDVRTGKSSTKAADRRAKRQIRRMLNRRRRRMARFRHCLQRLGLLPGEEDFGRKIYENDLIARDRIVKLNPTILPQSAILDHTMPYFLRAMALDYPLLPHELGRALYHLAQRRGFKSGRKSDAGDKEEGKVKEAIHALDAEMKAKGARTLGELFADCDTSKRRIREQYTSRAMYETEFDLICKRQAALLPEEAVKELRRILFFQRPLKSVRKLIGLCELEPAEKRCAWSRPEAQAFRVWQTLNNLVLALPDGSARRLSDAERKLFAEVCFARSEGLDRDGTLKFSTIRKLLSLPKMSKFTIESEGEKSIRGDVISLRLGGILGDRYFKADAAFLDMLFQDLRSFRSEAGLKKRLLEDYHLSESEAAKLSEYVLPEGYCNLSLAAIRKLLPELEKGTSYATAVKLFYPEKFESSGKALNELPSYHALRELAQIPNPGVRRALTQVRAVVNAVIRKYGRPDLIRVELARDLKNSARERKKLIDQNNERRKSREEARRMIEDATGVENPSQTDILKVQLAIECNWLCPYTGESIGMDSLLRSSQFDIEHIIPYSRSMDDSFGNKTLCHWRANRSV